MPIDKQLDVTGTCCPIPLIELANAVQALLPGQRVRITGDDPIFERTIRDYCQAHGYTFLDVQVDGGRITITLQV